METEESRLVRCECGARLAAPPKLYGRTIKCPGCGGDLVIPGDGVTGAGDTPGGEAVPRSPPRVTLQERVTAVMPGTESGASGPQVVVQRGLFTPAPEERPARSPPAPTSLTEAPVAPRRVASASNPGRTSWVAAIGLWIAELAVGLAFVIGLLLTGVTGAPEHRERIAAFAFVGLVGLALGGGGAYAFWRRRPWARTFAVAGFAAAALWHLREVIAVAVVIGAGDTAPGVARSALPLVSSGWLWASLLSGSVALALDLAIISFAARAGAAFVRRGR